MTTAEKIFGSIAAIVVMCLVGTVIYCVFWMHDGIETRDKVICKQDSTIIAQAQKIDSLTFELTLTKKRK